MGLRGLLLLLLVAAGLGAVLLFTDEKPPVTKTAETAVLDGRTLTESVRLRWQFDRRQPIEITRGPDGRFMLAEPLVDLASMGYMRQIIDSWDAAQMQAAKLVDDEAGQQAAGLVPPELVFRADFADGKSITVEIGGAGPLGDKSTRYLRRDGKLWVGHAVLIECLRVGLDDLREKRVFRHDYPQANELRVEQQLPGGKREALVLQVVDGAWRLVAPVRGRADATATQRFVTAVLSLRVSDFIAGMTTMPEREPDLVVQVRGAHGEENLKLWQAQGDVFGVLPGRNVTFTSSNLEYVQAFQNATEYLRARLLVDLGDSAIENLVEFVFDPGEGRGDRLRLVRESSTEPWRLQEPVPVAASATPCNDTAAALQRLVAREFVDDEVTRPRAEHEPFGLVPARRVTVQVRAAGQRATTSLWFGADVVRDNDTLVYACRADEPDTVVLVPKETVAVLLRQWTEYCAREVVRQTALVERLDLAHRDGRQRTFHLDGGKWVLQGTPGERPELADIANDMLRDLTGNKVVDSRGSRFATADWTLRLMRNNGDEFVALKLWDDGPERPLLIQGPLSTQVAFELAPLTGKQLRELWQ